MQTGQVFKRNGAWHLRFYRDEIVDGKATRRRISVRLAPINDEYRSKKNLQAEIDKYMMPVNTGALPEGGLTFAQFFEHHFLPHVKSKRKPSTFKFYRDVFRFHLRDRVGDIRLRDFTTAHAQGVLESIKLGHQSLLRIKTAMSAAFTIARQKDFIRSANPITGAKAEGTRSKFKPYAYTLKEIGYMLTALNEPARTAVAVAAFTGIREGEIRGLKWPDYTGSALHIGRAVWRTHVDETKTESSDAPVPVIKPLRLILDEHREHTVGDGFIFSGAKKNFALNLDNVTARDIRPVLGNKWHGWHAFRRGLATNLYALGVPPKVIQSILRHARVETTQKHYVVIEAQSAGRAAMKQLEGAVRRARIGQQKAKSGQQVGNSKSKKSTS
ncbi:MAG: site-specific integrase [Candidatus Sulfotelmatobacter sp.]